MLQGYNGWRNGLYGYSWDMMVYNVDVAKIQVKVLDHSRREQFFLDPNVICSQTQIYVYVLVLYIVI